MSAFNFIAAQLGARFHYVVPRILHQAGWLEHFYTDICAVRGWPQMLRAVPPPLRPAGLRRLLGRVPHGVPLEKITAFTGFGWALALRRASARSPSKALAVEIQAAREFSRRLVAAGFGAARGIFAYNSDCLEWVEAARRAGLVTVLDQIIAPKPVELQLLQHEQVAFPDWEEPCCEDDPVVTEFCAREQAGWAAADLILCGSEFVREGIARCGGPVERCAVVPYGVPLPRNDNALRREDRGRDPNELRVLTVGTVGLRKGSPYVLDAARRLKARQGGKIRFRMVGPVAIRPKALAGLREHVEVLGPVPRAEVGEHFAWADVFLLPSLCEGSATVTYEALVRGLPVVATPNTGSLVRDGVEGFIVPVRDGEAIAERLQELASNRDRLHAMAMAARARGVEATVEAYGARLRQALELRFMQLAAA